MNATADVAVPFATQPAFETEANELALSLTSWSVAELMQAFQCSESLAHDNQQRFQSFFNAAENLPAILAYHGEAYKHLRAETFTSAQFQLANAHHSFANISALRHFLSDCCCHGSSSDT